jgi:hypothetical protein
MRKNPMNTPMIDITLASAQDRAPPQKTVEAVLRRALKISDPRNVEELSRGLLLRYGRDAMLIEREKKGLPFSVVADFQGKSDLVSAKRPDVADAEADLERVLGEIARDPSLAEISAEMRGWARAIRAAAADGLAAARFALDPHSSDRAMTARRTLGDYARVSRYAAALASCGGNAFCRLAQACDALASLILVLLGDGLADAGVTRSTHIPRVPLATLRQRRDTVITELQLLHRNASGGMSPDAWPRGTVSLVQIYDQLATSDSADLRSLLDEAFLSRQLDDLLDLASDASIDGLKALGSAAMMSVRRFRRFISVVTAEISPPSPPLARFVAALSLFIQGFAVSAGGYRLPFIARSPLLAGQASLSGGADDPTIALIQIALARSAAAEWIDCLCCSCDEEDVNSIIRFTKMIYDLDRAIDLYAFGTDPAGLGEAEARAGAYGAVIEAIEVAMGAGRGSPKFHAAVKKVMAMAPALMNWRVFFKKPEAKRLAAMMRETLCQQLKEERGSASLVSSISPVCRRELILAVRNGQGLAQVIAHARAAIAAAAGIADTACEAAEMVMPLDYETALTFRATGIEDVMIDLADDD